MKPIPITMKYGILTPLKRHARTHSISRTTGRASTPSTTSMAPPTSESRPPKRFAYLIGHVAA